MSKAKQVIFQMKTHKIMIFSTKIGKPKDLQKKLLSKIYIFLYLEMKQDSEYKTFILLSTNEKSNKKKIPSIRRVSFF